MVRILCVAGLCEDYEMTCPFMAFGSTTHLTATVNATNFPTCTFDGTVNRIFFRVVYAGHADDICKVPFPDCNSSFIAELNGQRCSCTSSAESIWHYQLEFVFDKVEYKGATLRIISNCVEGKHNFTYTACKDLGGEWIQNITLTVPYLLI